MNLHEYQAKEILKTRGALVNLYVKATGKEAKIIEKAIDRDSWMSAKEALEFGLLDKVIGSYQEIGF